MVNEIELDIEDLSNRYGYLEIKLENINMYK